MSEMERLREVAEAATPGPWEVVVDHHRKFDVPEVSVWSSEAGDYVTEDVLALSSGSRFTSNAEHIATFDPPTVLALLDRLKEAERDRDKYLTAFSEQFDQREEYAVECRRLWRMEARVEALADGMAQEADTLDQAEMWDEAGAVRHYAHTLRAALSAPQPTDAPEGHGDAGEACEGL